MTNKQALPTLMLAKSISGRGDAFVKSIPASELRLLAREYISLLTPPTLEEVREIEERLQTPFPQRRNQAQRDCATLLRLFRAQPQVTREQLIEWHGEQSVSVFLSPSQFADSILALLTSPAPVQPQAGVTEDAASVIRQASNILFNLEQESGPGSSLEPCQRACIKEVREKLDCLTSPVSAPSAAPMTLTEEERKTVFRVKAMKQAANYVDLSTTLALMKIIDRLAPTTNAGDGE